jgi:hypothetical protein
MTLHLKSTSDFLPGHPIHGLDPHYYLNKDETAVYLERNLEASVAKKGSRTVSIRDKWEVEAFLRAVMTTNNARYLCSTLYQAVFFSYLKGKIFVQQLIKTMKLGAAI